MRNWAVVLGLVGFAGCSADAGNDDAPDPVDSVEVAATACESFTGTVAAHLQARRVYQETSFIFIFPVANYYAVGTHQSLGTDANRSVTLYRLKNGGFTADAIACSAVCGDGIVDPGEACDGAPTTSCQAQGYASGTIKCDANCSNDTSACRAETCGDGIVGNFEDCDGAALGGFRTCNEYQGTFTGGTLKCTQACKYDTSACTSPCGNGVIDGNEECDGNARAPQYATATCQSFDAQSLAFPFFNRLKYAGGTLTCTPFCTWDKSQCIEQPGCYWRAVSPNNPQVFCR